MVDISVLADSDAFQAFSEIVAKLTGLAMALYTPDGRGLAAEIPSRNPICTLIRSQDAGLSCCESGERAKSVEVARDRRPIRRLCHAGFIDLTIPVVHQGSVIAVIFSGQLLPAPRSEEGLKAFLPLCERFGISNRTLQEGYAQCVYMSDERIDAAVSLFTFFAEHLCRVAQQLSDTQVERKATAIADALRFIHEHITEELSLASVAAHIGHSPCYLSRRFRPATGCTFPAYIQRARVERIKHFLGNTSLPVTEIALMNGFNSISQLNRDFRRYCGCSPRAFRAGQAGL